MSGESHPSRRGSDAASAAVSRVQDRRWWIRLFVQPALLLAAGVALLILVGLAQRVGWLSGGGATGGDTQGAASPEAPETGVQYVCPMMCTPPLKEPGRCPVCGMKLVPVKPGGDATHTHSVQIEPAARRVANIRTAAVEKAPLLRRIRVVGELRYDEGSFKTIAAYVDGRLERLYADYTGVSVVQGDQLALVYSPRLYAAQVELLLAKQSREQRRGLAQPSVLRPERDIYLSARQRLVELGMTPGQIAQLEQASEANSRMTLVAPISGTVIRKYASEGQYVKEGQPIYDLADLSTVWLMLELFPEDAANIRYGQRVDAELQSLPGQTVTGRVAFIDPMVDPVRRTVGVRVVIPNDQGVLRVGDYAKATILTPIHGGAGSPTEIYDPDLADKWISPRHPHVVESSPGTCPICGIELVPSSQLGFTGEPSATPEGLVVPRSAVLMAGSESVVYVEVESGRFEIRQVTLGSSLGDQLVVLDGLAAGEQVAVAGNFLIDSQMQLTGKPSLIDPTKRPLGAAEPPREGAAESTDARASGSEVAEDLPPMGEIRLLDESTAGPEDRPQ
jgi:Cu(I)/Ag(I) efflux system membrane fusion protein